MIGNQRAPYPRPALAVEVHENIEISGTTKPNLLFAPKTFTLPVAMSLCSYAPQTKSRPAGRSSTLL
jgi:hypothetical protein